MEKAAVPPQDTQFLGFKVRLGLLYLAQGDFEQGVPIIEKCYQDFQLQPAKQTKIYAALLDAMGLIARENAQYKEALAYTQQALEVAKKIDPSHSAASFADIYHNLGILYDYINQPINAEIALKESVRIASLHGKDNLVYAGMLHDLAYFYRHQEKYSEAEQLYKEVLSIEERLLPVENRDYLITLNNLAVLYQLVGKTESAEQAYKKLAEISQKNFGKEHSDYITAIGNLAVLYHSSKKFVAAEALYKELLALSAKVQGKQHSDYAFYLGNVGLLYGDLGQYDIAENMFQEALTITQNTFSEHHPEYVRLLNYSAKVALQKGDYQWALKRNFQSLSMNMHNSPAAESFSAEFLQALPQQQYYSQTRLIESLNILLDISSVFATQQNADNKWEDYQQQICNVVLEILEHFETSFELEENKVRILAKNIAIVQKGLQNAVKLYHKHQQKGYIEQAFLFAERDKSILLTQALQWNYARNFGLPDSLAEKEYQLHLRLADLQRERIHAQTDAEKQLVNKQYNQTMEESANFEKQLETLYPQYFQLKYAPKEFNLERIQAWLTDESVLLEYFISDSTFYAFVVSKNNLQMAALPLTKDQLESHVQQLRNALSNYDFILKYPDQSRQAFGESAWALYQMLLLPVEPFIKGKKMLFIIPDGILGWIPFEALLTQQSNAQVPYSELPYLLHQYTVSYAYSAGLFLDNQKNTNRNTNSRILAMAAGYASLDSSLLKHRSSSDIYMRQMLSPLPLVEKEVKHLDEHFKGVFFWGNDANEHQFKQNAHEYSVLHLAMHGILNRTHPNLSGLVFTENGDSTEDNFLYAYEISNMRLNAHLVVLSACETGHGKVQSGEGVLSLARAFMYAGVPNLLVSLWSVNDAATATLMEHFYANLADNMPKAEALTQAKRTFIANSKGIAAHPAYWAAFVLQGDNTQVPLLRRRNDMPWYIAGIAVLSIGLWFFLRRRK